MGIDFDPISDHSSWFMAEAADSLRNLPIDEIDAMAGRILTVRANRGRLFVLGVGGGAGNAAHAVNDYRKLCGIEAYAPTDGISELTARANDDGFETVFDSWLATSNLNERDALMIFSVGGGNAEKHVSMNLVRAIEFAKRRKAKVLGIVGRSDGAAKLLGDTVIVVSVNSSVLLTPVTESMQMLVHHCLVSHPSLKQIPTKW